MRRVVYIAAGVAVAAALITCVVPALGQSGGDATPIYGIKLPAGYRDWPVISIASVGPPQNDLRVKMGNATAMQAFRDGSRPFPDGTIIARLAYQRTTSAENNAVLGPFAAKLGLSPEQVEKLLSESYVAGAPINVQFMVKDRAKYPATGGWGFAEFTDGKPDGEAVHKTCFACHAPAKDRDFVFTRYAP
jgi:hypothetical protein